MGLNLPNLARGNEGMSSANVAANLLVDREVRTVRLFLPVDALDEPGTYICSRSGHPLPVADADPGTSRLAAVPDAKSDRSAVTGISADPDISRLEARRLASSFGFGVNF
jgi:hypothetical protein